MTRNSCFTPITPIGVSRAPFDTRNEMINAMLVETPQNHKQAKDNVSAIDHV